jgi:uncharacterized protein YlaI
MTKQEAKQGTSTGAVAPVSKQKSVTHTKKNGKVIGRQASRGKGKATGHRSNQIQCSKCKALKGVRPDVLEARLKKAGVKTKEELEKTYLCQNCRPRTEKTATQKGKSGTHKVRVIGRQARRGR